jgi:3'(2'), 5'-bisphosphate nucleotidase
MDWNERNELALEFANIASEAGKLIMASRNSDVGVNLKSDGSPVTAADLEAERLIRMRLAGLMPGVAIIAEESFEGSHGAPASERFLLVDPLDGTREFVSGSDEFTVNIALIEAGVPVVGTIFAPALGHLYLAGSTAFRADVQPGDALQELTDLSVMGTSPVPDAGMRAIGSRSHMDAETQRWLRRVPIAELRSAGSSLKFCLIARGEADVYPRMAPTMEWDTAAGHAILAAAGGCVVALDGTPLRYGKADEGFKNDGFVAWGRKPLH